MGLSIGFAVAGLWLRPLYGISKNLATPAWCLLSSAICCSLYAILFWLVDVKNWKSAFAFLQPAGSNPLLAYILPSILHPIFRIFGENPFNLIGSAGAAGIFRSLVFAFAILALTALLTKLRIKLRL